MQTAEVVIIGGGIVGSSIAYHLTAAGCKDVLVIERETAQGKGSTGKSMGGVRAQFSTPVNIHHFPEDFSVVKAPLPLAGEGLE